MVFKKKLALPGAALPTRKRRRQTKKHVKHDLTNKNTMTMKRQRHGHYTFKERSKRLVTVEALITFLTIHSDP